MDTAAKSRVKIRFDIIGCFLSFVLLVGCATTQMQSTTEIAALRDARENASTHYFNNISTQELEQAVFNLFKLLDEEDVDFDLRKNKILVSRWWTYYAVLSVGWGKDFWEIILTPDTDGVLVSSSFASERHDGPLAARITTPFRENIAIGGNINDGASVADYYLLYRRLEYLLGRRDIWTTCEDAKRFHGKSKEEIVLCERIGIDDRSPLHTK
jgi:hypothetical protein